MEKKKKLLPLILFFLVLQIPFAVMLNNRVVIGTDPVTKEFKIAVEEYQPSLQVDISEKFQPDTYFAEIEEKTGKKPTIYGSHQVYQFFVKVFGAKSAINAFRLMQMLALLNIVFFALAIFIKKHLQKHPTKSQVLFEMIYSGFENLVVDTLGEKKRYFTPYILFLFVFIWCCNMIGMIPLPGFMSPTQNINVPLGLGILAVGIVHFMAIKEKGIGTYLKEYGEPLFFLAPLNVIGEFSKIVSISFRLFGNILGGAIITLVVASLAKYVMLPVGLNLFFGLFQGTIQAFVFTMLSLTYIAVAIND